MKKNRGKHDSGRQDGTTVFCILLFCLLLGFCFLLTRLPDPWGGRCAALAVCIVGMIPVSLDIRKTYKDKKANPHPKTVRRYRLLLAKAALCLYLAVVGSAWLFLNVPYTLFSALNMLPVPAFLVLYFLFPDSFTLLEKGTEKKHPLNVPLLVSGALLCLRTMYDFNFLNWFRLPLLCLVPLLILNILFLALSKERHMAKKTIFVFLFAMAIYLWGALGQANAVFDRSAISVQRGVLSDMHVHHGARGHKHYELTILLNDGDAINLETSRSHYRSLSPGDIITVHTRNGALNVPYAWAE